MIHARYEVTATRPLEGEHGPVVGGEEESSGLIDVEAASETQARRMARSRAESIFPGWRVQLRKRHVRPVSILAAVSGDDR